MEIKRNIVLILDLISAGCLFFMKLLIWPIFLCKEMSDSDGSAHQRMGTLFVGLGIVCPLTNAYLYSNFEISLKTFIQIIVFGHLVIGLMAHFAFKREFGKSFLNQ